MMICPNCNTQYADDTLKFCLKDGTQLAILPITETPTVILGETETLPSARLSTSPWTGTAGPARSNTGLAVLLTAVGMLVIFAIVGVGAWIYLKGDQGEIAKNANPSPDIGRNTNSKSAATVTPTPASTNPSAINSATPLVTAPAVNAEEVRREVAKTIMTWKSMAESLDLDSHMGNYADVVDYYRKKGASRSYIRKDRQRAFTTFDSIRINITNLSITPGASGQDAIATFDKEWNFEGKRRFSGTVRQQLRLKNFNGEWLITAEKDL